MKLEKLDAQTLKITAPQGTTIGDALTPEQLLADLVKYVGSPTAKAIQPRCAVCIAD
ncbi:hypothetical protein [Azospirillum picis]|uniref:Uncharacterized protein n=1 Tax=Azospirillum picis TaxID=488438 RepID=A0ABU0MUN3_9PROT|nr:hypothetical protein [Azospirillum picis]MBP2303365.1 hypothetical protein [Azospirillum picis]MDQ0537206.1 hypothetical protein [Azospirillum picis]